MPDDTPTYNYYNQGGNSMSMNTMTPEESARLYAQLAEHYAQKFHESYERLAPSFGYETREASAVPWEQVPQNNKRLMIAVCAELFGIPLSSHEVKDE